MLRTAQSLPLGRAFDAALRRQAFPPDAGSLLPGLLAATRTGLPPASDDEHEQQIDLYDTRSPPVPLGARKIEANGNLPPPIVGWHPGDCPGRSSRGGRPGLRAVAPTCYCEPSDVLPGMSLSRCPHVGEKPVCWAAGRRG